MPRFAAHLILRLRPARAFRGHIEYHFQPAGKILPRFLHGCVTARRGNDVGMRQLIFAVADTQPDAKIAAAQIFCFVDQNRTVHPGQPPTEASPRPGRASNALKCRQMKV
ncbi:MAG TPA: hypothetical protein VHZ32_02765 [Rhizomicrobium sp.]|nr:hypothetical protein [Rhizomicrobium sp.]